MNDNTITHLAGVAITIGERVIQRCSICGSVLADNRDVAVPLDPDGTVPKFPTWPLGRLIQVTLGNPTAFTVLPDMDKLPDDSCYGTIDIL